MELNNNNVGLSIDTSTRYALVGISVEGQSIAELSWRSQRNHSVELVPALQKVLAQARMTLSDISVIYVAIGPGGFSALRVGISTAIALAKARDIPLVTIGTMEVEVYPYRSLGCDVVALIGAGRSRLYVGYYRSDKLITADDVSLLEREWFLENHPTGVVMCGEEILGLNSELFGRLSQTCHVIVEPPPTRQSAVMAAIGFDRLDQIGSEHP